MQEEPHPDVESLSEGEQRDLSIDHLAGTLKSIVDKGDAPDLDYESMPMSSKVEDRRGEEDVTYGKNRIKETFDYLNKHLNRREEGREAHSKYVEDFFFHLDRPIEHLRQEMDILSSPQQMTDAEHGAATVAEVVTKQAKDGIPNLDYETMPASTNIEDRRREAATAARGTGKGGQLFDSGNQDVQELTDYLQHLKDTETKAPEQSTHTHPAETDGTLNRLLANTAAGKLAEWGAYAGLANAAPKVLPALNALWMGAWIASGHQLRADIEKQVKEGKSLSEIKFEKGSLGDMGGIISALQEKYKKD